MIATNGWLRIATTLLTLLTAIAGCQCSGDGSSSADSGSTAADSDTDADTDIDVDTDADSDSDSDTGSDSCPGEETDVALDPALEWEEIPDGMECGVGCKQLTNAGMVEEFDVWGDLVIVAENTGQSSPLINLVDVESSSKAVLDLGFQTIDFFTNHPTLYDGGYHYVLRDSPDHEYYYTWGAPQGEKGYKLLEPCTGALYELDAWSNWLAYVFEPNNPGMQDLYVLNRETLERKAVTDFGGIGEITISGDWITFTRGGGNAEIYAYNVTTEELTNVSDHPSDQFNSRNDGPRVVWTDLRADPGADYGDYTTYGAADIWFYDIETEELRQITSENGIQLNPDINGDWIVWHDYRECPDPDYVYQLCAHIWGYNLVTEEERKISSIVAEDARVWGSRVYFEARYSEEPVQAGVFVQDLDELPDAGPDGGK